MFETANVACTATWPAVQQCYAFRLFAASCIATCFMILAPTVVPAALVLFMRGFSGTLSYIIMYVAISCTILLSPFVISTLYRREHRFYLLHSQLAEQATQRQQKRVVCHSF